MRNKIIKVTSFVKKKSQIHFKLMDLIDQKQIFNIIKIMIGSKAKMRMKPKIE